MQTMGRFDLEGWSYNFARPTPFLLPLYPCLILYPCPPSLLSKHLNTPPPPPLSAAPPPISVPLFIRDARAPVLKAVQI